MEALRFALLGVGAGALYAVAAQGIVLVYRASGTLNFAHGALAALAAYIFYDLRDEGGRPTAVAIVVAILVVSAVGLLMELVVMRPLRDSSPVVRAIATLGVLMALQTAIRIHWGPTPYVVAPLLPTGVWRPTDELVIGLDRLCVLGIGVALTGVLWLLSTRTRVGLATTAVAENPIAAVTTGWSPQVISALSWVVGSACGALAGILLAPIAGLQVDSLVLVVVPALAAALIGRFTSLPLTLLGGILVGVVQSLTSRYITAPGWSTSMPFFIIVGVLVLRGYVLPRRGHLAERLPKVGDGRPRPVAAIVVTAAVLVVLWADVPAVWVEALATTFVVGVACLSVVVVTGYAGQLSLAQFALAGVGAFAAGRLVQHGLPFELGLLAAPLLTIPVGLVVAIPSLRTRGITLAVATLGLGLAIQTIVFSNSDWTGGFTGTVIGPAKLFGLAVSGTSHPQRYATMALIGLVLVALAVANLRRSTPGARLLAVRENERAAAALGLNVMSTKLYAFGVAAAIAGIAGVLFAYRGESVVFTSYTVMGSINLVTLAVIGGVGYVTGGIAGAALAGGALISLVFDELGPEAQQYIPIVTGVLLIVFLIQDPNGMISNNVRLYRRLTHREPKPPAVTLPDAPRARARGRTLEARGVTVRYGGVLAVDDVSFTVRPGQIVGIIGPNGAGKTSLLDALSGFTPLASGSVWLDGERIDGLPPHQVARRGIGRSFQSLELFDEMTVYDNLRVASDAVGTGRYLSSLVWPGRPRISPAGAAAVADLGLAEHLARRPSDLPYGVRRLTAIARAAAADPAVLLLDEPAAGLGDEETDELGRALRRLAEGAGVAIVLIEHDVDLVLSISDHVVALDFGRVIASGPPSAVRQDPAVIASYLGAETPAVLDEARS